MAFFFEKKVRICDNCKQEFTKNRPTFTTNCFCCMSCFHEWRRQKMLVGVKV